ncbi:uncharacterized protein OCT59_006340 [Rhizophagus irregularis]|uniref:uncharacterized protein n=1 Tax=Rhizophagus irregularis TaxID=588596 RepID=UPI0033325F19|nr:hypothetical protein OCT59_006340 [Rhizophagus irregularis]
MRFLFPFNSDSTTLPLPFDASNNVNSATKYRIQCKKVSTNSVFEAVKPVKLSVASKNCSSSEEESTLLLDAF